mmetsp:Transcript_458/g.988  ORF Transcript_458/g.988 Transcript_458/m.988 type:complete len:457 (-) Transcript_458:1033-2403(-)
MEVVVGELEDAAALDCLDVFQLQLLERWHHLELRDVATELVLRRGNHLGVLAGSSHLLKVLGQVAQRRFPGRLECFQEGCLFLLLGSLHRSPVDVEHVCKARTGARVRRYVRRDHALEVAVDPHEVDDRCVPVARPQGDFGCLDDSPDRVEDHLAGVVHHREGGGSAREEVRHPEHEPRRRQLLSAGEGEGDRPPIGGLSRRPLVLRLISQLHLLVKFFELPPGKLLHVDLGHASEVRLLPPEGLVHAVHLDEQLPRLIAELLLHFDVLRPLDHRLHVVPLALCEEKDLRDRLAEDVAPVLQRVVCAVALVAALGLDMGELREHVADRNPEEQLRRAAQLLGRVHVYGGAEVNVELPAFRLALQRARLVLLFVIRVWPLCLRAFCRLRDASLSHVCEGLVHAREHVEHRPEVLLRQLQEPALSLGDDGRCPRLVCNQRHLSEEGARPKFRHAVAID